MMSIRARSIRKDHCILTLLCVGLSVSLAIANDMQSASYKRKGKVDANHTETSANNTLIRVQASRIDFGVAFGLGPGLDAPAQVSRGKIITLEEPAYKDEPCWEVTHAGYAVARGWRPRIRGTTATAAAEGSTILFERQGDVERVYVPSGQACISVEVWLRGVDAKPISLQTGEFVEVKVGQTTALGEDDIQLIADVPHRQSYVSRVMVQPIVSELPEIRPSEPIAPAQ